MVILKLTKPVSSEFECEVDDPECKVKKENVHLVRPCERYEELYKSCKSIRGRLHQYYVYGELFDCSIHKSNYTSCMKYRETKKLDLLYPVIEWEQNLISTRLKAAEQNKVWEFRQSPPEDFNGPLPDFIEKRQSKSFFKHR